MGAHWPQETKDAAIAMALTEGGQAAAAEYGVPLGTIRMWVAATNQGLDRAQVTEADRLAKMQAQRESRLASMEARVLELVGEGMDVSSHLLHRIKTGDEKAGDVKLLAQSFEIVAGKLADMLTAMGSLRPPAPDPGGWQPPPPTPVEATVVEDDDIMVEIPARLIDPGG